GLDSDLRWSEGAHPRSWIVTGDRAQAGAPELPHRRAAFAVDGEQLRAALAALGTAGPQVRLVERRTPVAALPYVIVDGEIEHAWFCAVAQRLGCFATAVHLRS